MQEWAPDQSVASKSTRVLLKVLHPKTSKVSLTTPRRRSARASSPSSRSADGKASIVVGVTDDLTKRISAVDLVRLGAEALGGKGGGGRPDMAQAGGPDVGKARDALAAIEQHLAQLQQAGE